MANDAKKKKKVLLAGINSVMVGPCSMGGVTVTADVSIPAGSININVNAQIVPAGGGPSVAGGPLTLVAQPSTYSGRIMGISGTGPFKAKVDAYWYELKTSGPIQSAQFNCQAGPTVMGARGDDDCCG